MEKTTNKIPTQSEFIALFPNTRFRYIHDVNKETFQGNNNLDLLWNQKGYGIFFTVNGFSPTGKADQSQLLSLNANYVDFDVDINLPQEEKDRLIQESLMAGLESGAPTPTFVNRTQKGAHLIWLYPQPLNPAPENIAKWKRVQNRLVRCFNGDKNAIDPTRVLRVPHTLHLKDPQNPFEIKIVSYKPDAKCSLEELDSMVPQYLDSAENKTSTMELLMSGVPVGEGLRHGALAQIAGLLLKGADTPAKVEIARTNYYHWDQKIVGSPERFKERKKELDNTFNSILEREQIHQRETGGAPVSNTRLWSIGEILSQEFGDDEWLVESLIPKQGMTVLSGCPGEYKTWITIHTALCLSRGFSVFNKFNTAKGSVLIIDEEDHMRFLKKRLESLGAKDADNIYYLSQSGIKVDDEGTRKMLVEIIKEKEIKLLILDSLVRVHQQEENDAKGMAKVFGGLQEIIQAGASILFTHHHRKQQRGNGSNNPGQSMRGSSDILAAVDGHIMVEKNRDEEDLLTLRQTKSRQSEELKPFSVKVLKNSVGSDGKPCPSGFEYTGRYDEKKKKAEEVADALAIMLAEGMRSRPEIIENLDENYGRDVIDQGIKLAEEAGKIEKVPKEILSRTDRKAYYRLPIASGTSSTELPASVPLIEARKQEAEITPLETNDLAEFVNQEWKEITNETPLAGSDPH